MSSRCCLLIYISTVLFSCGHSGRVYDVIILGGGIAGVHSARTLVEEGVTDFIIIEARDEIGGRMQSQSLGGYTVELGAVWTQGVEEGSDNPMYKEVKRYHLEGEYNDWDDMLYYNDEGLDVTEEALEECDHLYEAADLMYEYTDKLLNNSERWDMSVRSALRWFGFNPQTAVQMACDYFAYDFEFAYEADILSAPFLDWTYDDFGDGDFLVTDTKGYSSIPKSILADYVPDWLNKVHFETRVTSVDYTDKNVTVHTTKGCFTAKKAILTFSIGVLQNKEVSFSPNLPEWKWEVIQQFLFADYLSVYFKFNESITWFVPHDTEWITYASTRRGYFPLWQNYNKFLPGSHILQATVTNNEARRLQSLTDEQVKIEAISVLRTIFGQDIPDAEEILFSRLHYDPLFHGSYSSWPLGFTEEQHKALRAPVGPVYFAGEAYSQRHYGYTHGAMLSAEATVKELVDCLKNSSQCTKPYVPPYARDGCTCNNKLP